MTLSALHIQVHAENQPADESVKIEESASTDHTPQSRSRVGSTSSIIMENVNKQNPLQISTLWAISQRRHSFTEGDEKSITSSMTSTSDSDCYSDLAELMSDLTVPSSPWSSSQRSHSFSEGSKKSIIKADTTRRYILVSLHVCLTMGGTPLPDITLVMHAYNHKLRYNIIIHHSPAVNTATVTYTT